MNEVKGKNALALSRDLGMSHKACWVMLHKLRKPWRQSFAGARLAVKGWNDLAAKYEMKRINHQEAYSLDGACTNMAESYFSRIRRAKIGHHHHIAGAYLLRYAQEHAWREDARGTDNGAQVRRVAQLALTSSPSVDFSGYYQRHLKAA